MQKQQKTDTQLYPEHWPCIYKPCATKDIKTKTESNTETRALMAVSDVWKRKSKIQSKNIQSFAVHTLACTCTHMCPHTHTHTHAHTHTKHIHLHMYSHTKCRYFKNLKNINACTDACRQTCEHTHTHTHTHTRMHKRTHVRTHTHTHTHAHTHTHTSLHTPKAKPTFNTIPQILHNSPGDLDGIRRGM